MSLAAFQQLVDDLVRDTDQVITPSQRDDAIANALARYSVDAPRRAIEDVVVAGDGSLVIPAAWASGSRVMDAEYPIGQRPMSQIPLTLIEVRATPTGDSILLLAELPLGDTVRLTFSAAHQLDATIDTVPAAHRRAVAALAGSDLCGQLAAHYSNESAPTIGADTVDHQGKSLRWRNRSRDLAAEYSRIVGPAPNDRAVPASAEVVLPGRNTLGGRRLFHPPEWPR